MFAGFPFKGDNGLKTNLDGSRCKKGKVTSKLADRSCSEHLDIANGDVGTIELDEKWLGENKVYLKV